MYLGRLGRSLIVGLSLLLVTYKLAHSAPSESIVLDNGMQIYLKSVANNSSSIDLRLIVGVGAADEGEGEKGWAHLVEHMAFNGTRRFSAERMNTLFQQAHFRPGRDINASTSFSNTIYKLTAPADDLDKFVEHLELIEDWLSAIEFSPESLMREKRIIAAEALEFQGDLEIRQRWQQALFEKPANNYTLLGDLRQVHDAKIEGLHHFWKRNYRADNATLLISGDFDSAVIAAKVKFILGRLPKRERSVVEAESHYVDARDVVLSQDQRLTDSRVAVAKLAVGEQQIKKATLAMLALQWRFDSRQEMSKCGDVFRRTETLPNAQELHYVLRSSVASHELNCLAELSRDVRFLREVGLDSNASVQLFHYAQSKGQQLEVLEQLAETKQLADQLQNRLIKKASVYTEAERLRFFLNWMERLSPEEINEYLAHALEPIELSLIVQTSEASSVSKEQIRHLWTLDSKPAESTARIPKYEIVEAESQTAEQVIEVSKNQWTLRYANGAQVHLLLTDNIRDHFDVLIVREGGVLSLPSPLVSAAIQLPAVLGKLGVADQPPEVVQRAIREHRLGFSWFVENFRQGMRASARTKDATALFSLLHEAQLELPDGSFEGLKRIESSSQQAARDEGSRQLRRVIWRALYDLGEASLPAAPNSLDAASYQAARNQLFTGTHNLHVHIAGDFDPSTIRQLANKYIGSLPSTDEHTPLVDLYASAKRQRIVHRGNQSARADLFFYYVQSAANNLEQHDAELLMLREVLAQRLWQVLREKEGLGYGVNLSLHRRPYSRGGSSLQVSMVSDPSVAQLVRRHVDEVLLSYLVEEVDNNELAPLRRRLLSDYQKLLSDNASLLDEWSNQRERGRSLREVRDTLAEIEAIDAEHLQQYARKFFRDTGFLEVNVVPGMQLDVVGNLPAVYPVAVQ